VSDARPSLRIAGDPDPEVAAAISAAVGVLLGGGSPVESRPAIPAWRRAGLHEGVASRVRVMPGVTVWRASADASHE